MIKCNIHVLNYKSCKPTKTVTVALQKDYNLHFSNGSVRKVTRIQIKKWSDLVSDWIVYPISLFLVGQLFIKDNPHHWKICMRSMCFHMSNTWCTSLINAINRGLIEIQQHRKGQSVPQHCTKHLPITPQYTHTYILWRLARVIVYKYWNSRLRGYIPTNCFIYLIYEYTSKC